MNDQNPEHRISCHRCGNIRKRRVLCINSNCPHTFCGRCSDKLHSEYGSEVFAIGCPVCQELCCCTKKSVTCTRQFHCYRKCPATKYIIQKGFCQEVGKACNSPKSIKHSDSSTESSDNESIQKNMQTKYLLSEVRNRMEEDVEEEVEARDSKRRRVVEQQQHNHHQAMLNNATNLLPVNDTISYMIIPPVCTNDLYNMDYRPQMIPIFPFYYMPLQQPVPYQPLDNSPDGSSSFESGIDLLASISSYNYLLEQTKVSSC